MVYDPEDVDLFIAVADAIEVAFPDLIVEGEETEGGTGQQFLMTSIDGRVLFERGDAKDVVKPALMVEILANDVRHG